MATKHLLLELNRTLKTIIDEKILSGTITIDRNEVVTLRVDSEGGEPSLDKQYNLTFFLMMDLPTAFPVTVNFNLEDKPSQLLGNAEAEAETAN